MLANMQIDKIPDLTKEEQYYKMKNQDFISGTMIQERKQQGMLPPEGWEGGIQEPLPFAPPHVTKFLAAFSLASSTMYRTPSRLPASALFLNMRWAPVIHHFL